MLPPRSNRREDGEDPVYRQGLDGARVGVAASYGAPGVALGVSTVTPRSSTARP